MEEKKVEVEKINLKVKVVIFNFYFIFDVIYVDYVEDKFKNIFEENFNYSKMNEFGMFFVVEYEDSWWGDNVEEFLESFLCR